jgi:hypothetical protein
VLRSHPPPITGRKWTSLSAWTLACSPRRVIM